MYFFNVMMLKRTSTNACLKKENHIAFPITHKNERFQLKKPNKQKPISPLYFSLTQSSKLKKLSLWSLSPTHSRDAECFSRQVWLQPSPSTKSMLSQRLLSIPMSVQKALLKTWGKHKLDYMKKNPAEARQSSRWYRTTATKGIHCTAPSRAMCNISFWYVTSQLLCRESTEGGNRKRTKFIHAEKAHSIQTWE